MLFADVIVDISVKSLDRPFQYIVPEALRADAVIGAMVVIPFGNGNRELTGYIIELSEKPNYALSKIKKIKEVVKQGVIAESHLLSLAYWIRQNYGATMNDAIRAVLPVKREVKQRVARTVYLRKSREETEALLAQYQKKNYKAKARILRAFLAQQDITAGISCDVLRREYDISAATLRGMETQGVLEMTQERQYRNPVAFQAQTEEPPVWNAQQRRIIETVTAEYRDGVRKTYLIHGVTGSGKTEVYMGIIAQILAMGKQVIVLIPEIALTFQTVERFYRRFGDRVSVMHSRLSQGERFDQYTRAREGKIDIMIGPRSALFTPFERLGLIVVDEEHETSYQSEMPPKYHAREVAVKRASMVGASVILGSATPSLEAYYRAQTGRYQLFTMTERAGGAKLPQIWVTDLREELQKKNRSIFGEKLTALMEDRLQKQEQTILFINRRGYAGSVSCRKCGEVMKCPHCSVSLTAHMRRGRLEQLMCHYCGYQVSMPSVCPACGSQYIGTFGIGTQKVEQLVRERFPAARVLRMDADTTTGKEGHEKILQSFAQGEADILIGTQMIVKGHDFPNVTLVGVLAADLSLNVGDFRAAERTYQLLAQAAGRAGRGEKPGDVVLQTYQPEHYSIACAARQDYMGFYEQELAQRRLLQYPPVSNILGMLVLSPGMEHARQLSGLLAERVRQHAGIVVLGPAPAPLAKAKDIYRYIIYIKCHDYRMLRQIKNETEQYMKTQGKECRVHFEFN